MPLSYTTHTVASTASGSGLQFSVNYPYILRSHVKVYYGRDILAGTHTSLLVDGTDYNWTTDTQITLTAAPSSQSTLTIIRETPTSAQLVPWQDGSNLIADDLNKSDKQNLYAVQELQDKNGLASDDATAASAAATAATTAANNATTAANNANTAATAATTDSAAAVATANAASATANTANTNATAAQTAATAAQTAATNAANDAAAAQTSATAAQTSATAAQTSATSAQTSATAAATDAASAVSTANSASTTATTANTNANTALSRVNTYLHDGTNPVGDGQGSNPQGLAYAINTANTANTTATSASSTANTASTNASNAVTTANAASATANAASAAVANAAFYSPIAALANLPSSPSNQDRVEVVDSTGVQSSSAVSGVPSGFTGSSDLTVRLQYNSSTSKWEWQQYFAADPENRYAANYLPVIKGDGTTSGQVGKITLNCSNNNHGVSLSSPPHSAGATYNLTLPTSLPSVAGQALTGDTSGNLSFTTIDAAFVLTPQTMTASKTIAANTNAGFMGPVVALQSGAVLTIGQNSQLTLIS